MKKDKKNKNRDYWLERKIKDNKQDIKEENELLEEIFEVLAEGYEDTEKQLYAFYQKFGDEEGLSYQQAQKLLTPIELKDCAKRIKRLKQIVDDLGDTPFEKARAKQIQKEIRILQGRGRITREQALLDGIAEKWIKVANEIDEMVADYLEDCYGKRYSRALEDVGVDIIKPAMKQVQSAILMPTFAYHFSDTIWKNKDRLLAFLNTEIRKGIVQGTNPRKIAKKLMEQEKVTYYQAKRIVVTESNVARIKGTLDGYKDSSVVKKLEVLVVADKRTCKDCLDMEGVIVEVEKAIVGDNVPPFH